VLVYVPMKFIEWVFGYISIRSVFSGGGATLRTAYAICSNNQVLVAVVLAKRKRPNCLLILNEMS